MWLCPVISLSRYLFFYPDVLKGDVSLFEGKSHYTQYATRLKNLVKQLDTQLTRLGFEAEDLGSHSCCKGVATMVASGYTVSLPIVVLCIWAGWFLGGVKDKHFSGRNLAIITSGAALVAWINRKRNLQFPHHILILQNYVKLRS